MMIVMKATATEDQVRAVIERIESCGAKAHPSRGEEVTVIGAVGDREHVARGVATGPAGLDAVYDGLDLVLGRPRFHHDHHLPVSWWSNSREGYECGGGRWSHTRGDRRSVLSGPWLVGTPRWRRRPRAPS